MLGLYKGRPTTVGSTSYSSYCKAESFSKSGWFSVTSHPRETREHTLIGLETGAMILAGGRYYRRESKDVWILRNNDWSIIGHLKSVTSKLKKFL